MKQKLLQRITALLLAMLVLPQAAWALQGKGTLSDPYKVEYGADLATIRIEISQGKWADGVHIDLVNDIVLSDGFQPLGTTDYPFTGVFYGDYHNIRFSNVHYTSGNFGIFAVTHDAQIMRFTVSGTITSSTSGLSNIGSVVGRARRGTVLDLVQSSVNININGVAQSHIGGLVGHYEDESTIGREIRLCLYSGVINAGTSTDCIGGILGYAGNNTHLYIENCSSIGSIYSTGSGPTMGGILGYNNNENHNFGGIRYCFSSCGLHYKGSNENVSGIAGRIRNDASKIVNNYAFTDSCGGKLFNTDTDASFAESNELVTFAQCKSGYVTYQLSLGPRYDLSTTAWKQRLNSTDFPILWYYTNRNPWYTVYKIQDKKCDGTTDYGEPYYSNTTNYVKHHTGTWVERVEPTCTTDGNIRYYHCNDCGKNYSSETATNETTDITLPAQGHLTGGIFAWSDDAHSATCTEKCFRSGCTKSASATATYPDGGITRTLVSAATCSARASYQYRATCTVNGNKYDDWKTVSEGDKLPHNFSGGECTVCHEGDYLTFTSTGSSTIALTNQNSNAPHVEYSLDDGSTWTTWDYSAISLAKGEKVQMRGVNPNGFSNPENLDSNVPYSYFTVSGRLAASGSLMSLIDGHGTTKTIPSKSCFKSLFYGCSTLTTAPQLPATTLTEGCYEGMFRYCMLLTEAPELPATKMANSCYQQMFSDCQNLEQAPALPATTLDDNCYDSMFSSCTALTQAPALPADSLAKFCYQYMFRSCTALTQAPELPAKLLARYCYNAMFNSCTALTQAPELPATKMDDYCYTSMFKGCTALAQAPELPATKLADGCYSNMFMGCESLSTAPKLPADSLAEMCYKNMFYLCSKLSKVEVNFTEWSDATRTWLVNVAATGEFICPSSLPQTRGYSYIPEGWTITVKAPAHKTGDVNGDGDVDVVDINCIIDIMLGSTDSPYRNAADVNGDGAVDIVDINCIIQILLGE